LAQKFTGLRPKENFFHLKNESIHGNDGKADKKL
jgi:hypothetical protein